MLHHFLLAPSVYTHLGQVVHLQIACLRYAASVEAGTTINSQGLAKHLPREHFPNAEEVANWCWKGKRVTYLQRFVAISPDEQPQKALWVARITKEMTDLLDNQVEHIAIGGFLEGEKVPHCQDIDTIATWKGVAQCFLLYFYEAFLEKEDEKYHFPACLFEDKRIFGRREFFQALKEHNREITICPICDEGRYYTQVGERFYGFIDHFLPKAQYPHFSCHPCNLIPTCYNCNASFKGTKDPLDLKGNGQRQPSIARSALPYVAPCGDAVYLTVTLDDAQAHTFTIHSLTVRPGQTEQKSQEAENVIGMLKDLYMIPERWDEHKIGEMVFRRMRQFLDNGRIIPTSNNTPSEIYNSLEQLLYYLNHEDRQRDPFAFALTWALVACIREQVLPCLHASGSTDTLTESSRSALLEEIEDWFFNEASVEEFNERSQKARQLLSVHETLLDRDVSSIHEAENK